MKNLLFFLFALPFMSFDSGLVAQANVDAITKAISSGDATALGVYFDQNVEIAILDNEDILSKAEAINSVRSFFSKNKPTSFSQVHQGTSKGSDSQYTIGNMSAGSGKFRVYIYLSGTGGKMLIQELRFDKA